MSAGAKRPFIPLIDLAAQRRALEGKIEARLAAVVERGDYVLGREVSELERALADYVGGGEVVTVANGTDALLLSLMAAEIGPGDAVFVPAFTFLATAEVVVLRGASPVFVDVDPDDWTLDPEHLKAQIAEVKRAGRLRPRAVIPVDLFGLAADYEAIGKIARREGLLLIADAAQSFGGAVDGRRVGRLAPVTSTSFYPSKPLSCYGDGGAVFVQDPKLAENIRRRARHGFAADGVTAQWIGLNSRLDTLQAAVLLAKLEILDYEIEWRQRIVRNYVIGLVDCSARFQGRRSGTVSANSVFSILVPDRDRLRQKLTEENIGTAIYYPKPLHLQPAYAAFGEGPGSLPVSEALARDILALPMHPYLGAITTLEIAEVVSAVLKVG